MDTSPIRKNKSGSIIPVEERKVIYNVFKYFKLSDFNMTVESIVIKTASACGVSENTVYKIIKEKKVTKTLKSPVKKRVRPSTVDKLDELDKCAIRAKVHSLYLNNDYPTLDKIMTLCEADEDISTFKRTTLHKILPEIGFDFNKRNNRSLLVEREDIVLWRRKYLRQITKYRKENKTIYFLDETWVNTGHVKTKAGTDSNTDNSRHTSQKSLSTRARAPTGKVFTTNILRNLTRMVQKGPRPLVLCGPSGSGKSTLLKRLLKEFPDKFGFSVSHTTRAPRPGEKGGVHYHFRNIDDMTKAVKRGEFIETATFSGNLYGTSKQAVDDVRRTGKICVLDIDIEGVKQVTTTDLNPLLVFVMPPSIEELERRLRARNTEQEDAVQKRLDTAKKEITFGQEPGNFHIIILNDNLNKAYSELREFISKNVEDKEQALRGL
ncbi:unnamed protein product [Arctia plantaginis]|uniref:guanylate kinase n=1 Tax=Arctia plantaginis TaxID=874455 RepID=A0A8S1A1B2_ARCPL|nr:unnamed protein product [Arctia plantaginis]